MRWDRLFEDLETQLASEWEAERAALESESERLRLARLPLRERLRDLRGREIVVAAGGDPIAGEVVAVGADVLALRIAGSAPAGLALVPLWAPLRITAAHEDLLRSARAEPEASVSPLTERMTLGFLLRDLARKRHAVRLALASGVELSGTLDRVGADHLDLAEHEPGTPRRSQNVRGYRLIAFSALSCVRVDEVAATLL